MPPLVPQCAVCALAATPATPLSTCSRCGGVVYCSRDHQKQDFAAHKRVCNRVEQCRALLAREETALRSAETDMFLPANVFEEGVATFGASTRHGRPGLSAAMPLDNMGVRDAVPVLMLLLGQLQQCYDFVKWRATCDPHGTCDWGDTSLPYLSVQNADMTETTRDFDGDHDVFHLAALTFIKMALAKQVAEAVTARIVADSASLPTSLGDTLGGFLSNMGNRSLAELQALQKSLQDQAERLFKLVHKRNTFYWKYVLDPMPLAREPDPGAYTMGDRFEVKLWIVPNALLWRDAVDFIKENAKKL